MKGSYTSRWIKIQSDILIPAMERQGWVICGWRIDRVKIAPFSGTRNGRRSVSRNLSRWTLAAPSDATAIAPTIALPGSAAAHAGGVARWITGPFPGVNSTKPSIMHPKKPTSYLVDRCHSYEIEGGLYCAIKELAQRCGMLIAPVRAHHLQPNPSGPATLVPHPALPAKELHG